MWIRRSLLVLVAFASTVPVRAAAPPVSDTPGAIRLGSDRLRVGRGKFIVAPNGRLLASGQVGGVCLWDLPSGKVRRRFEFAQFAEGVPHAFCPESRWLAVSLNRRDADQRKPSSFSLIDAWTGSRFSLLERGASYQIRKAAFLNRSRAVCCFVELDCGAPLRDAGLHVWSLPSRKKLGQIQDATCFATSPRGDVIVTGHEDGSVRFHDAHTLKRIATVPAHSDSVWDLAMSPDGRLLASTGKGGGLLAEKGSPNEGVVVWDVASRKRLKVIGDYGPLDLAFTTNDALCRDVLVDDARTGRAITPAPIECDWITRPAFSSNGAEVAFARPDGLVEVQRVDGKGPRMILRNTPPAARDVAFANGGRTIVVRGAARSASLKGGAGPREDSGDHSWCGVWDRVTGRPLHGDAGHRAKILRVAYSRDGKTLASVDGAGLLRLSRVPGGAPHPSFSPEAAGWVMDFRRTADGERICAIGDDGRAVFWDLASGGKVRSVDVIGKEMRGARKTRGTVFWDEVLFHPLGTDFAIDPAGRVAVVRCSDKSLEAVRLDTGRRTRIPFNSPHGDRPPFAISPEGRYLASSREYGFELRDLSTDERLLEAGGGTGFAFSSDGRYFAWGEGHEIGLFDLKKRKKAGSLLLGEEDFDAREIAFDLDAKTIAARDDSRVIYWDLETKRRLGKGWTRCSFDRWMVPLRGGLVLGPQTFLDRGGWIRVRDTRTGMGFLPPSDHHRGHEDEFIAVGPDESVVAVSPDGRVVAVGGRIVTLIEGRTGKILGRLPCYHRGLITAMAFSPDGKTLTTGGTDAAVLVWDWKRFCGPAGK